MEEQERTYGIVPRSDELGSGWKLTLFEGNQEAGGGVFPVPGESPEAGIDWWNSMTEKQRGYWMTRAASAVPADARRAYLLSEAYVEARLEGEAWVRQA